MVNVLTANNYDKQTVMKVKRKIDNNGNAENRNDEIEQTEYVGEVFLPYIRKTKLLNEYSKHTIFAAAFNQKTPYGKLFRNLKTLLRKNGKTTTLSIRFHVVTVQPHILVKQKDHLNAAQKNMHVQ